MKRKTLTDLRNKAMLKWSFLLLFAMFTFNLSAQITVDVKNVSIKEVLKTIEAKSEYRFFYNEGLKDLDKTTSLQVKDATIDKTMTMLLANTNIGYKVDKGNLVLLMVKPNPTKSTQKKVSGFITDEKGEPIIGASIKLVGTNQGTITDFDGKFSIETPQDGIMAVSYIGFQSLNVSINGRPNINITLIEDSKLIDEVVVVGYGTQRKMDVTTSIASLRAKDIAGQPVTNVLQAMGGKMPGVQISQTSGQPGSGLSVKVRGVGTITAGNEPLYVIDGITLSSDRLQTFNMNDIESVEVLKDASSAAIYGSRGSNGVVLITTKKGVEGKTIISYNGSLGMQSIAKKIDMLDAYQYSQMVRDSRNNTYSDLMLATNAKRAATGLAPLNYSMNDNNDTRLINSYGFANTYNNNVIIPQEVVPYLNNQAGLTNTDWQNEIYRNAAITDNNISLQGGSKNVKYYTGLEYLKQDGIILNSNFKRYSARFNLDANTGILKVGVNFTPSHTTEKKVSADGLYNANPPGIVASALHSSPIFSAYNSDGSLNFGQNIWSANTVTQLPAGSPGNVTSVAGSSQTQAWNPVAIATLLTDNYTSTRILGSVFAELALMPNLKYKIQAGTDYYSTTEDTFYPSTMPQSNTKDNPPSTATGSSKTSSSYMWSIEQTLQYNKKIKNHSFNAIVGWTAQQVSNVNNSMTANGFLSNSITTLNAGVVSNGSSSGSQWSLLSALGRVQYNYLDKYLVSAAFRSDGSSRFGANHKWGTFPSASAAWRITEESFMKNLTIINDLKLRTSYGLTGNFNIPNYGALGAVGYNGYVLNGVVVNGAAPTDIPNPSLSWEKTKQVNLGLDIVLFNNSLRGTIDVYNSNTNDLLLNVPVPTTTGYKTQLQNIGKVNNKGIELSVGSTQTFGKLTWSIDANISKNINTVVALGPGDADIIQSGSVGNAYFLTRVGESIGSYYLPVAIGVFKDQADLNANPQNSYIDPTPSNYGLNSSHPGDFKFEDVDDNGVFDPTKDRKIVGNYMPKFTYGFNTSLSWNSFDLGISFQGVYGNKVLNLARRYFYNHEGNMNNYAGAVNRWISPDDSGSGMNVRANRVSKGNNGITSTWHLEDGSYLRVKNITFGYNLPAKLIKFAHLSSAKLYVSSQNPFTFTKYSGYNPEVSNRSSVTTNGEDYGVYPTATTTTIGLNVTL